MQFGHRPIEHFYTGANLAEHTFYKDFGGQYKQVFSLDNTFIIIITAIQVMMPPSA